MRVTKIIDGLYTRGKLGKRTLEDVLQLGVGCAVSLIPPGEPALEGWPGYIHWPLSDGNHVVRSRLNWVVRVIIGKLREGTPVLVMCRAGRNRTGLVVSAVLVECLGIPGREALRLFREKRPRGVDNRAFEEYLVGLSGRAGVGRLKVDVPGPLPVRLLTGGGHNVAGIAGDKLLNPHEAPGD